MTGRHASRSKNGCSTCRIRKIKCDEARPLCGRCRSSRMTCEWLPSPPRKPRSVASVSSPRPSSALVHRAQRVLLPRDVSGFSAGQQLGNSLHLSAMDREYLVYFPQSLVVKWLGKPFKWGFLRHLHTRVASQSSMVMRMILACSASELESRRLTDPGLSGTTSSPANSRAGVAHYGVALRELSGALARCRDQKRLPSREMVDEIVICLFFMITYEHLFSGGQSGLAAHLSGIHAFLETCGVFAGQNVELGPNFSHVTKNTLLLMMYVGINYVSLAGDRQREGWVTAKDDVLFFDLLDQLYHDTRDTNSLVFEGSYPPEALLDDITVYQPLEFIHECIKLRYSLLPLTQGATAKQKYGNISHLSRKLSQLGKRFNNLVRISQTEKPPEPGRIRELQTIYYSVSDYHALQIVIHRLGCANTDKQPCGGSTCRVLQELVTKLTSVLRKVQALDPSTMSRVCWPLAVAAEVVEEPQELLWIQETVNNTRRISGSSTNFNFAEPA